MKYEIELIPNNSMSSSFVLLLNYTKKVRSCSLILRPTAKMK